ncbi:MAG: aspartate 1-decarboxylase [Bacteroidota bacterium]
MYQIKLLQGKVHGITITDANVNYDGSLTLDIGIMEAAGMIPGQEVHVVNNNNGERIVTYLIKGKRGSGMCCLNGAAARKGVTGDKIIVMTYLMITKTQAKSWKPTRVFINDKNKIQRIERK